MVGRSGNNGVLGLMKTGDQSPSAVCGGFECWTRARWRSLEFLRDVHENFRIVYK